MNINEKEKPKVLLVMLPFNDPQIPPLGLANLKSFLKDRDYPVSTVDLNVEMEFRELFDDYFETVREKIPEDKRGNFYSMRLDIMQYQMLAYLNYRKRLETTRYEKLDSLTCHNPEEYRQLVKTLVHKTFFVDVDDQFVEKLDKILARFFQLIEEYVLRLLRQEKPAVFGLSVCIAMLAPSLLAFKLCKEFFPHIKTVMGGGIYADDLATGSPNFPYLVGKIPYVDKLIVGEGELLFYKFLQEEFPPEKKVLTLDDINGEIVDLSKTTVPDFDDFHLDRYPYISANASVGCAFNCTFCTVPTQWGKYRKKDPAQVVREFTELYRKYGTQLFLVVDSLLNPLMNRLAEEFIKSPVAIYWDGSLKVSDDVCNTDNTMLWRRGGFYRAHIGVETGSQRVLDLMDKRITVQQVKTAISALAHAGIKTTTFWVVGYPGETEEDFQQTLDFVEEIKDDIYETTIRPYLHYLTRQERQGSDDAGRESQLLYPEEYTDKLMVRTWISKKYPSREETFQRLNRFNDHIRKLGIPNPYSWLEIDQADKRWKALHENSVPPLVQFKNKDVYIDECKKAEKLFFLHQTFEDDGEFGF